MIYFFSKYKLEHSLFLRNIYEMRGKKKIVCGSLAGIREGEVIFCKYALLKHMHHSI